MPTHRWLLLLGSNLAGPERVQRALETLPALGHATLLTPIERMPARRDPSRFYYNALATLDCDLDSDALRARLKQIETELGRVRDGSGEVAIDIDLLAKQENGRWLADPHALDKREFAHPPARALIEAAAIAIDMRNTGNEG
ncbi:MAG TPA: 2-amino-4-hydroxy-6-hydroxymethyldihydropteridine diphosphokinase [Rhodanobacteraceae bacterium]|jgi:2-amino-4-hydroxy-6-hydroxymethyldihydropteridine diphosphokinase|nr:2-amino-4-hydroxy-6-hydroxymethyldihydropteridine diphosphokinase [Rhodanobacteraceae bacterium]